MQWVSASSPVAAVTAGGTEMDNTGSTNTRSGTSKGLMIPFFCPSASSIKMALGETSLPVPEVAGAQMSCFVLFFKRPLPTTS